MFSFWWILAFLFRGCHLGCLAIYFSCSGNRVFQIVWLYLVLASRSEPFNFVGGTSIVTGGSSAVYLNPGMLSKAGHISAFGQADPFIKFLDYISFTFPWEKHITIPPASWLQIDCYHGNSTVLIFWIFLFKQNFWHWESFPDCENLMLPLMVGLTLHPVRKPSLFSKKTVWALCWLVNPSAAV